MNHLNRVAILHVELTPNATNVTESALVDAFQNTTVIHTLNVGLNVFRTPNVHRIALA